MEAERMNRSAARAASGSEPADISCPPARTKSNKRLRAATDKVESEIYLFIGGQIASDGDPLPIRKSLRRSAGWQSREREGPRHARVARRTVRHPAALWISTL